MFGGTKSLPFCDLNLNKQMRDTHISVPEKFQKREHVRWNTMSRQCQNRTGTQESLFRWSWWSKVFTFFLYVYLSLGSPKADPEIRFHVRVIYLEVLPRKTGGQMRKWGDREGSHARVGDQVKCYKIHIQFTPSETESCDSGHVWE